MSDKIRIFWTIAFLAFFSSTQAQKTVSEFSVMSDEKRKEASKSFRDNFKLIQAMKVDAKSQREIIVELTKNKVAERLSLDSVDKLSSKNNRHTSFEYQLSLSQTMTEDKYLVKLAYSNDENYPIMYGGSGVFRDNKDANFIENKSNEILTDFLGEGHSELNAKLIAVTTVVILSVEIDDPDQFDSLLEDPMLLDARHLGNPPDLGIISIED